MAVKMICGGLPVTPFRSRLQLVRSGQSATGRIAV
jgi:hypothetical protein